MTAHPDDSPVGATDADGEPLAVAPPRFRMLGDPEAVVCTDESCEVPAPTAVVNRD